MDENNQYGNAMTKPLPTGRIKKMKRAPTLREFELILQVISDTDKIGHLFLVDIDLIKKTQLKNKYFSMKFIHQYLKRKRFCLQMKDRFFSF